MKMNYNSPYGVIYGDNQAKFEQNGILFDAQGNALDINHLSTLSGSATLEPLELQEEHEHELVEIQPEPSISKPKRIRSKITPSELKSCEVFLKEILKDGYVARMTILREAKKRNLRSTALRQTFVKLDGLITNRYGTASWELPK